MVIGATVVILCAMTVWSWQARPPAAVPVQAAPVVIKDIYNSVTVSGTIEAADSTAVAPAASAVVDAVHVEVGQQVEQGTVLCTVTPAAAAGTSFPDGVQSVWQALSGQATHTVTAAEERVLRAPVSGTVLELPEAGQSVLAGMPCIQIADLEHLQVRAQSPELYAGELACGQRANVTVAALDGEAFGAEVVRIAPIAARAVSLMGESGDATVEAILSLTTDTEGLRPGYSASVKIFTDYHKDAVAVPMEAVCQRGEQEYVFCVQGGRAVQCAVETGYMLEEVTEIQSGLDRDAVVILSPPDSLRDGDRVEVMA